MVEWPSGQWQQTVNLSARAYVGSNPTSTTISADLAQQVEHIHGKDGVPGSSPGVGSIVQAKSGRCQNSWAFFLGGTGDGKGEI